MGSLTALDIVVLVLVGGGAVLGFTRGLVQEVTTLLAWVLAIVAVRLFHGMVRGPVSGWGGGRGGGGARSSPSAGRQRARPRQTAAKRTTRTRPPRARNERAAL